MTHGLDVNMEYDPSNAEFTEWLASKFYNHKTMDQYTKNALQIYWTRADDEVELTDEESSNSGDENEVAEIFRIDTNDGYENTIHDHEERENVEKHENKERCKLFDNPHQETPVCSIRRFEMIKYSFGQDGEYVAVKEHEYDDLTRINEDACRTYQEIFRRMDERIPEIGFCMFFLYFAHDLAGKEIDKVVIMESLVKISKKARILELKRRHLKINDSDILYAVSIKEDTVYLCLHFKRNHEDSMTNTPYLEDSIRCIQKKNKMHKAFPLPVIEFPLPVKKVPTARRKEKPLL
nr:RNA-directed DNA polymerase, eukaryota, reverse transcriptase zinc-binding domain protein [Tanacetum cinerariifolium]